MIALEKQNLRQRVCALLEQFMQSSDAPSSQLAVRALMAAPEYLNSRVILAYVSFSTEICTDDILQNVLSTGRTLVLPRTTIRSTPMTLHRVTDLAKDLEKNRMGFLQPRKNLPIVKAEELDLVIAPGVAFDTQGHRLLSISRFK